MSTQEILAELPLLSVEDQGRIASVLRELEAERTAMDHAATCEPRVAGLHAGAWIIHDDFDEPATDSQMTDTGFPVPDPLQVHPELAAAILYNPTEPASEDEWPAEVR